MVKRREVKKPVEPDSIAAKIEAFIEQADGENVKQSDDVLDPNAKRDYKSIRVPFNEFEFQNLEDLAAATGRSKLNAIKWAISVALESVQK